MRLLLRSWLLGILCVYSLNDVAAVENVFVLDSGGPSADALNGGVGGSTPVTTDFTFTVGPAFTVNAARVRLSLSHRYISDISAKIISPSGTEVELFEVVSDGLGGLFQDTHFEEVEFRDDAAAGAIPTGSAGPYTVDYKPQAATASMASFLNEQAQGQWRLVITDYESGDVGYVYGAGENTDTVPSAKSRFGVTVGTALILDSSVVVLKPIEQWRLNFFGISTNTGSAANTFDGDDDDVPNLLEYALARNPTNGSGDNGYASQPSNSVTGAFAMIIDMPNPAPTDVIYRVQASSSIGSYVTIAEKTGVGAWNDLGSGAVINEGAVSMGRQTVSVSDARGRRFMVIQVEETP